MEAWPPGLASDKMDPEKVKNYLADDPPTIVPLSIKSHFMTLTTKQKKYAHHLSL